MSIERRLRDMLWRDDMAARLLGEPPVAKTSGGYMVERLRHTFEGWLYVGRDALVFIADQPIFERSDQDEPFAERVLHLQYSEAGRTKLTAPFGVPNGIVEFANGPMFMGRKRDMKTLHKIANATR